jgi:hypothetical protein
LGKANAFTPPSCWWRNHFFPYHRAGEG